MKKIFTFIIVMVAFGFISDAFGQENKSKWSGFFESETEVAKDGKVKETVKLSLTRPLGKKFSVNSWTLANKDYQETYVTIGYAPNPCVEFGAGAGVENTKTVVVGAAYVFVCKGRVSNFFVVEKGKGLWYQNTLTYKATKNLKVFWRVKRFAGKDGFGIQYELPKKISLSGTYYPIEKRTSVAVRFNFK